MRTVGFRESIIRYAIGQAWTQLPSNLSIYINQYHILLHLWWLQRIFTKKWSIPDVEDAYIPTVVAFAFPWLQYLFTRPGSVFPRLSNWPPSHEATNSTSTSSRTAAWFFSSNTRRVFGCVFQKIPDLRMVNFGCVIDITAYRNIL